MVYAYNMHIFFIIIIRRGTKVCIPGMHVPSKVCIQIINVFIKIKNKNFFFFLPPLIFYELSSRCMIQLDSS